MNTFYIFFFIIQTPTILATDPDKGENGTKGIRYSLAGHGSKLFDIDPLSGKIVLHDASLDRETTAKYQLKVFYSFLLLRTCKIAKSAPAEIIDMRNAAYSYAESIRMETLLTSCTMVGRVSDKMI